MSSKVETSENATETDVKLFFLKLISYFSNAFVSYSTLQFYMVNVSKKFNSPFYLAT
jgi:hypothetical protein